MLAVTGSAVGLGNFLRFPGQAARYGGGAFLIPYLVAFLVVGLPMAWAEWALGRYGGACGRNSPPGIFRAIMKSRHGAYVGMLGTLMPTMILMYYLLIEAWCLAYAFDFLTGRFAAVGTDGAAVLSYFNQLSGCAADGWIFFHATGMRTFIFIGLCFAANMFLIYRGIHRGIERFCNFAMPLLMLCALCVLARVLTLSAPSDFPEQTVMNGLGYLWNPTQGDKTIWSALANPETWLAATGQVFLSLSVGFGLILTYASYLKPDDDVVLSGLTAAAGNEFCEVILGGMIAIPAAFVFLGFEFVRNPPGTFGMGFVALPNVFNRMPMGNCFGFLFFFLLFLAAITSSLSMMQPSIAFFEEGLRVSRKISLTILSAIVGVGCLVIAYFSKDFQTLDTLDFWMANFFIFILATIQSLLFAWALGKGRGMQELQRGAKIKLPVIMPFVFKYVSPAFLLAIFFFWAWKNLPERLRAFVRPVPDGAANGARCAGGLIVFTLILL